MNEQLDAVRVPAYPETRRNKHFFAGDIASELLTGVNRISPPSSFRKFPSSGKRNKCTRTIPRTCTVQFHFAYAFAPEIIQQVICDSAPRTALFSCARELS